MLEIQDNASPQLLKIGFLVIMLFSILSQSLCVSQILGISMVPTLQNNSIVIAHKTTHIKHGDIVIFEGARYGTKSNLIKRVIGLPGDRVTIKNGTVYINGNAQEESYLLKGTQTYGYVELIVEKGTFYALGDNREMSLDSRDFGLIQYKDIIGVMGVVI